MNEWKDITKCSELLQLSFFGRTFGIIYRTWMPRMAHETLLIENALNILPIAKIRI
jgi:hypothetical protein